MKIETFDNYIKLEKKLIKCGFLITNISKSLFNNSMINIEISYYPRREFAGNIQLFYKDKKNIFCYIASIKKTIKGKDIEDTEVTRIRTEKSFDYFLSKLKNANCIINK